MKTIDFFTGFESNSKENIGKSRPTFKISCNQREVKASQVDFLCNKTLNGVLCPSLMLWLFKYTFNGIWVESLYEFNRTPPNFYSTKLCIVHWQHNYNTNELLTGFSNGKWLCVSIKDMQNRNIHWFVHLLLYIVFIELHDKNWCKATCLSTLS